MDVENDRQIEILIQDREHTGTRQVAKISMTVVQSRFINSRHDQRVTFRTAIDGIVMTQ